MTVGGETEAVSAMLAAVAPASGRPAFSPTHVVRLSSAESRVLLAALTARGPVSPLSGEPIEPDDLWGADREPLPQLFERQLLDGGQSDYGETLIANRVLMASSEVDDRAPLRAIFDAARRDDNDILASHLIDGEFVRLGNEARFDDALHHRDNLITGYVTAFVESRAEWDLSDRASINELVSSG